MSFQWSGIAAGLVTAACLLAPPIRAAPYEADLQIEDEVDLYDLAERGDLTEDERDELLDLFRMGVDLNSASREELYALPNLGYPEVDAILEYRRQTGGVKDPAELVAAGGRYAAMFATWVAHGGTDP